MNTRVFSGVSKRRTKKAGGSCPSKKERHVKRSANKEARVNDERTKRIFFDEYMFQIEYYIEYDLWKRRFLPSSFYPLRSFAEGGLGLRPCKMPRCGPANFFFAKYVAKIDLPDYVFGRCHVPGLSAPSPTHAPRPRYGNEAKSAKHVKK